MTVIDFRIFSSSHASNTFTWNIFRNLHNTIFLFCNCKKKKKREKKKALKTYTFLVIKMAFSFLILSNFYLKYFWKFTQILSASFCISKNCALQLKPLLNHYKDCIFIFLNFQVFIILFIRARTFSWQA